MKTRTTTGLRGELFFVLLLILIGYTADCATIVHGAEKEANTQAACLECHGGSFDKLASENPTFKAPSGETINPHTYIPHNAKKAENVPDCTDCHTRHPIPLNDKVDLAGIKVDSCYSNCHHENNFQPCRNCHKKH